MDLLIFRKKTSALPLVLFLSGASGLLYEILWMRTLALSFGNTTYAMTTVLAIFMGGLALGSRYLGKFSDKTKRPLRLYAFLEIGIGIYCLAVPRFLAFSREIHVASDSISGDFHLGTVLRFALAFLVLIIPTTMMGGTLPAVCRALVRNPEESSRRVGILYGANTLGAAAGAFAGGYWLLPALGIRMTNLLAVGASLLAGTVILFLYRDESAGATPSTSSPEQEAECRSHPDRLLRWSFAISGATGMAYQIAWTRAIVLVVGSSTYAFSAILVTFLLGIALGSLLFSRLKTPNDYRFFALLQFGIAASTFLLLPAFHLLPRFFFFLFQAVGGNPRYVEMLQFLVVMVVVLLPTTLMGMAFPSLTGLSTREVDRFGANLGNYYARNTVGAIGGSVLAGFLLIPRLGTQTTLALAVLTNTILGGAFFLLCVSPRRRVLALIPALFALLLLLFPQWDKRLMSSGVFYLAGRVQHLEELTSSRLDKILYFREGLSSTIAVAQLRNGGKILLVNGKVDAGDYDMKTQVNLATFPLLLHPEPRRIAVIGLGSGVTAGIASLFRQTERIDIVELEPAVREASKFFDRENHGVLRDPKVHLHVGDGRNFMEESDLLFDVVISEPSNPWMRGIANLYTREFFKLIRDRLDTGGIFCQWIHQYSISPGELKMIVRSFHTAFPDSSLWRASEGDLILLGRKAGALPVDLRTLLVHADQNVRLLDAFRPYGGTPVEDLVASYLLGPKELQRYAMEGPLNTDDRPLLEFSAPRSLYLPLRSEGNREEITRHMAEGFPYLLHVPSTEAAALHYRVGQQHLRLNRPKEASREFLKAFERGYVARTPRKPSHPGRIADIPSTGMLFESFDMDERRIPLVPRLGAYRPDDGERANLFAWSANMEYFEGISGVRKGAGIEGGQALVLRGVAGVDTVGYFVPLGVRPGMNIMVDFSMKSMLPENGDAGVGVLEYDTLSNRLEEPTQRFEQRHRTGGYELVRIRGGRDWQRYSFQFTTSPRTHMAHVVFFREGSHSQPPVVFDDITIHEVR